MREVEVEGTIKVDNDNEKSSTEVLADNCFESCMETKDRECFLLIKLLERIPDEEPD